MRKMNQKFMSKVSGGSSPLVDGVISSQKPIAISVNEMQQAHCILPKISVVMVVKDARTGRGKSG